MFATFVKYCFALLDYFSRLSNKTTVATFYISNYNFNYHVLVYLPLSLTD